MRSPKLNGSAQQYYRYYAGYTQGFVEDMFHRLSLTRGAIVVDPWNGAGTTTSAAARAGIAALGYDINPAAVIIGRARLLSSDIADSLVPLAAEICDRARAHSLSVDHSDLLRTWFGDGTASKLRALERATYRVLVDAESDDESKPIFDVGVPHSPLAAVFYVGIFRVVRDLVRQYVPSNPAWIKYPDGRRIGTTWPQLQALFMNSVKASNPYIGQLDLGSSGEDQLVQIHLSSSGNLPLEDATAEAVISSPPYCTRIDYVRATLPELAVLGLNSDEVRHLRDMMIGTPTMSRSAGAEAPSTWGRQVSRLIDTVEGHRSKASATYYRRYYLQYFDGMWGSLKELHRILKPGCPAVLVLQDSFYKDVHVDLPSLIGSMSEAAGWSRWERIDFNVPRTMAAINPATRQYRADFRAVESAVVLER